jgi:hypothetical protein
MGREREVRNRIEAIIETALSLTCSVQKMVELALNDHDGVEFDVGNTEDGARAINALGLARERMEALDDSLGNWDELDNGEAWPQQGDTVIWMKDDVHDSFDIRFTIQYVLETPDDGRQTYVLIEPTTPAEKHLLWPVPPDSGSYLWQGDAVRLKQINEREWRIFGEDQADMFDLSGDVCDSDISSEELLEQIMATFDRKPATPPLEAVKTPLPDDDASAVAWLGWLAGSRFNFHLEDPPHDIANFTKDEADLLEKGVSVCFNILGADRTWAAYSTNTAEE